MSYRSQPGYVDPLLAVRGLSALGVLLVHCLGNTHLSWRQYLAHGWQGSQELHQILLMINPSTGKNFVLLFFVHSGYLIGKVFCNERYATDAVGIARFYRGRLLRIAPLLWFNLVVCLALSTRVELRPVRWLGEFLFVSNYTGEAINGVT
jgi:peptidoglycan/LPS O-acetylase OafA/YrhL